MVPYKVDIEKAKRTKQRLQEEGNRLPLWTPKEGRNRLRFLPPWSEVGDIGYESRWHWNVPPDHNPMPCLRSANRECLLCDYIRELRVQKNPIAQEIYAKKRIYYNVIVRDEEKKGVQVYASGVQVYENILAYLYDDEWGDITDIEKGRDMILERTGQGKEDTRYNLLPAPNPSPLHTDQQTVDKWLSEMQNLDTALSYPEDSDVVKIVAGVKQSVQLTGGPENKQLKQPSASETSVKEDTEKKDLVNKLDSEISNLMEGGSKL